MINYSIQDVCFLPEVYRVFLEKVAKFSSLIEFDLISDVFKDSRKCNTYAYININCCTGIVLDSQSLKFIKSYFQMGDMLNLEIKRIDIEDKKIVLTVPDYYLKMDPDTISYYCFYAKSQNEKKLTREYINIYYNKNQAESAPKTNLKLTSRTFFKTTNSVRERGYSDNSSSIEAGLDTSTKRALKNSESTDKLQNILEEQKTAAPVVGEVVKKVENPPGDNPEELPDEIPERSHRKRKIKPLIDNQDENGFTEVPRAKRYFPKSHQGGAKSKKFTKQKRKWTKQ